MDLHEIDPTFEVRSRGLRNHRVIDTVDRHLDGFVGTLVEITRELTGRVRELTVRACQLEQRIAILIAQIAPSLLTIPGCGAFSAAKIVGESAGVRRFRSRSAYARWNGTAPQPVWSGRADRFRLSRGGNRQVNAALHRIAVTQARMDCPGRDYIARRIKAGNSRNEALRLLRLLRLLRRRLSDVVFRTLLADESNAALT